MFYSALSLAVRDWSARWTEAEIKVSLAFLPPLLFHSPQMTGTLLGCFVSRQDPSGSSPGVHSVYVGACACVRDSCTKGDTSGPHLLCRLPGQVCVVISELLPLLGKTLPPHARCSPKPAQANGRPSWHQTAQPAPEITLPSALE